MGIVSKIRFVTILEMCMGYCIEKNGAKTRYKPRLDLYLPDSVVSMVLNHFKMYLPMVNLRLMKGGYYRVENNKNVMPLLDYLRDDLFFCKKRHKTLSDFVLNRMSVNKKRYDQIDEEYYIELLVLNKNK